MAPTLLNVATHKNVQFSDELGRKSVGLYSEREYHRGCSFIMVTK